MGKNDDKLKDKMIAAYVAMKKLDGCHEITIKRDDFVSNNEWSRRKIVKVFGSYNNLIEAGEAEYLSKLPKRLRSLLSERQKKFDPDATSDQCIDDLRRVQKEFEGCHISRTDYRNHGKYSDATWSRHFGTFEGFREAAGLELTRHQKSMERHIAKHSSIDHYRDFFRSEILPYINKYEKKEKPGKLKTVMVASDIHDRECDRFSLSTFIEICRIKQPDNIALNGDIYDLKEFGRYSVDPRDYDIKGRFDFVDKNIFAALRNACPDAQIDLIAGNHEMRLLKLMADATPNVRVLLSDVLEIGFSQIFGLDKYEINWVSKFDLGAYNKSDINNEIKKNYKIYYETFVLAHIPDKRLKNMSGSNGHHHVGRLEGHTWVDPATSLAKFTQWTQTPALHIPYAEYLNNVPGWNVGFAEANINTLHKQAKQLIHHTHDGWCSIDGHYFEAT